jgi:hypothetical protein
VAAHFTTSQRALACRLRAKGLSLRDTAKEVGCSHSGIDVMLRGQSREAKPDLCTPRPGKFKPAEWPRNANPGPRGNGFETVEVSDLATTNEYLST